MNVAVDRVVKECGRIEVDLTLGADTFRIQPEMAQALGLGLLEASQPADSPTLAELSS